MSTSEKYNNNSDKKAEDEKKKALEGEGIEAVSDDALDEVAGGARGGRGGIGQLGRAKPGSFNLPGNIERL
ncbi:MAG: hypothetical protein K6E95_08865 [Lachnospiraceae bacterium]|nr:hypothetical protein [Lachnospiraceae bacterium]